MVVISVSISAKELKEFDEVARDLGFSSRSDAVRAALHRFASENRSARGAGEQGCYVISVSYDERKKHQVTEIIHRYSHVIRNSLHTHFDNKCLEQLTIVGEHDKVKALTEQLSALKDVRHSTCIL